MADRTKTGPTPKRDEQRRARKRKIPLAERLAWVRRVYPPVLGHDEGTDDE